MWNGIVIGSGVGISINCTYKISTEKTIFSMPESKLGMVVGVGAMYHLSKLD